MLITYTYSEGVAYIEIQSEQYDTNGRTYTANSYDIFLRVALDWASVVFSLTSAGLDKHQAYVKHEAWRRIWIQNSSIMYRFNVSVCEWDHLPASCGRAWWLVSECRCDFPDSKKISSAHSMIPEAFCELTDMLNYNVTWVLLNRQSSTSVLPLWTNVLLYSSYSS